MGTIKEMDKIRALAKAINDVKMDRDAVRIQTEMLNREMEVLSETVKMQKEQNEKKKEMLELLNGILNREKEQSAAISACKSTFDRSSAERLLWFAKAQVNKSQLLQELKQIEVEDQFQKCVDDYADQDPKYRQLKEKQMQLVKLQDEFKNRNEEIIQFKKFVARDNAVEVIMLREQIVELARVMVKYSNPTFPKTKPQSSVVKCKRPMNAEEHLKSFEKVSISYEPIDANVNDVSDFKIPPIRRSVKRKPIEASADRPRTLSSDEKFKLSISAKVTNEALKAPHRSILKSKEVKATKMLSASANMKQSQRPLESSEHAPHMADKQKTKSVKFVGLRSSVESDIVSLSGTSQKKESSSNSKRTSNIDIAMESTNIDIAKESPNDSDGSDIVSNKENVFKERSPDDTMEVSSNASSTEQNTPMDKSMEGISNQPIFEMSPNFNFEFNYGDPFGQFTTPKSKPSPTDADLDNDNSYTFGFNRTSQPTADDGFNFMNPKEGKFDFSHLF